MLCQRSEFRSTGCILGFSLFVSTSSNSCQTDSGFYKKWTRSLAHLLWREKSSTINEQRTPTGHYSIVFPPRFNKSIKSIHSLYFSLLWTIYKTKICNFITFEPTMFGQLHIFCSSIWNKTMNTSLKCRVSALSWAGFHHYRKNCVGDKPF